MTMARAPADAILPDTIDRAVAEQIAAVFVDLYRDRMDDRERYAATRHILWQAMACMVNSGIEDQAAVQTLVAALIEILSDGLGPAGTAAHLRLMADALDAWPPGAQH